MINYEPKVQRSGNTSRGCQTKDLIERHICTDKMRSCDTREHSDWLRVFLGYKSVKIFHSAMILK